MDDLGGRVGPGPTRRDHLPLRPSAFREVFERRFTYLAGVERNSHRFAYRHALHDPASGRRWTYAELWTDSGRLAAGLGAQGVDTGDVVVFELFNGAEFVLAWLAAQRLGAIAAPINFRLSSGEVAYVLDDSRPAAFVYDEALAQTAADALARASHTPRLTAVVGDEPRHRHPARRSSWAPSRCPTSHDNVSTYDETTRLYTSGTTGMPKGVSLSGLVDVLSAHDVIMHFPLSPEDRTLNMTPWFHRGGLYSGGPNPVLYVGAEAVALRAFDPATVLDWVAGARPHVPDRSAHEPGHAGRRAVRAAARPLDSLHRDRDHGRAAGSRGVPALPAGADAADLQRLRDHRGVLEHLPAPQRPARACRLGRARLHRRRRRGGQDLRGPPGRPRRPRRQGRNARSARSSSARSRPATPTSTSPTSRPPASATAGCTSATWPPGTRTST